MNLYVNYTPTKFLNLLRLNSERLEWKGSGVTMLNSALSFDIETSSFYLDSKKYATMYVWAFDIFDVTFIGRTWEEFTSLLSTLSTFYKLTPKKLIRIYVHNLSYEFQFMRKWLTWRKVFASKSRAVIYAISTLNIEFRCSYFLYGSKLSTLAEDMNIYSEQSEISKIAGYDYSLLRHSATPLSDFELDYVITDVKIVTKYIKTCIAKEEEGIASIPLTKTGYVRRLCRNACLSNPNYYYMIHAMNLTYPEYITAKGAFAGGFVHSNPKHTNIPQYDVTSFDFASSYPAVMLSEKYPMSSGMLITRISDRSEFEELMNTSLCTVTLTLRNIKAIYDFDYYISLSKCEYAKEPYNPNKQNRSLLYDALPLVVSNGRIVQADEIRLTITSIDYRTISELYTFEIVSFQNLYYYQSHYLPKEIITSILTFYNDKTLLKGIPGKEEQYMLAKQNLNSVYGMTVTDILRNEYTYDSERSEWSPPKIIKHLTREAQNDKISIENSKQSRFLFYLWGCFVTAYARRNLWAGIFECGDDYIYSDTDSIKILNASSHLDFINDYNSMITEKIDTCLTYYNLDPELSRPKGKQMGVWDFDGHYRAFKTLGAKRYIYLDDSNNLHCTISGLAKKAAETFITKSVLSEHSEINYSKYSSDYTTSILSVFTQNMTVPAGQTGKLTHSYCDYSADFTINDYNGIPYHIHELSFIHLEDTAYSLSVSQEFLTFLQRFIFTET